MKDRASCVSANRFSKWSTIASISSSQNGGLASKDPLTGKKLRMGLMTAEDTPLQRRMDVGQKYTHYCTSCNTDCQKCTHYCTSCNTDCQKGTSRNTVSQVYTLLHILQYCRKYTYYCTSRNTVSKVHVLLHFLQYCHKCTLLHLLQYCHKCTHHCTSCNTVASAHIIALLAILL